MRPPDRSGPPARARSRKEVPATWRHWMAGEPEGVMIQRQQNATKPLYASRTRATCKTCNRSSGLALPGPPLRASRHIIVNKQTMGMIGLLGCVSSLATSLPDLMQFCREQADGPGPSGEEQSLFANAPAAAEHPQAIRPLMAAGHRNRPCFANPSQPPAPTTAAPV
ncbi:hypothetical protein ACCO45_007100 [Purpureocillium lilacinum]|uniref:Uncharacterized protein n=1 Tax=Purpureocillium lilacinum TaxID=33203 RepID=A0ACC4DSF0_PURLI